MANAPVIIEAALNGITSRRHNPHVPVTPDELAAAAIACVDAGATVVHTHSPDPTARPEARTEEYAQCYRAVLAERPGTILYPTTGIGATVAERYAHVGMLASEGLIRATFVDPGSVNLGGAGSDGLPPPIEYVYTNTFAGHPLRVRPRGPAPARAEHRGVRARLPPGGARVPRGRRAPGRHAREALLRRRRLPHARSRSGACRRSPKASTSTSRCWATPGSRGPSRSSAGTRSTPGHPPRARARRAPAGRARRRRRTRPATPSSSNARGSCRTDVGRPVASLGEAEAILGLA